MPFIAPELIIQAKQMDLLTYLKNYEPYELVKFSGNTYCTRTHDSLKISNGKWIWWSRGIGGRSALDYLIKVKGYSFLEAVETIIGHTAIQAPVYEKPQPKEENKPLLLPEKCASNRVVTEYLFGRGIDFEIINYCISNDLNVGGQPYWSWYGFDSRVEWCACFVSWCANECGYIDAGIIPKYAGCVNGVQWFRDRGQWADGSYEPSPGTIIFFDWEGDGVTDHTGIVQKCENGTVYTVEGNSGDTCRTKTYTVGSSVIYGYGIPAY